MNLYENQQVEARGFDTALRIAEVNGIREVTIRKVLNGFLVRVGCQEVVFETKDKMMSELSRYLDNPVTVSKEYLEKK